jgi:hypothetical protein
MVSFDDLFTKRPALPPAQRPADWGDVGDLTSYVSKVCDGIVAAVNGTRNDTLNRASYTLSRIVAAGQLDETDVRRCLTDAGRTAGLDDLEIRRTIDSGFKAGLEQPRALEPSTRVPDATVIEMPDRADLDAFWESRDTLATLHQFARARMCSPWAVLGCALVRVVTAVPPFHALPALVGSEASLNLFVALVGPSGTGKGAAESAAADAIDVGHVEVAHVGSGEGIAHLYAHREKGEVVRDREAVLFTIPEVDNLTALSGRQGATLLPQLRMAWSGERLGFAYVDRTKNLPIEKHSYRLGLLLGVQPGRAAPLLDDTDGGTPQRFLWMPTTDPDVPDSPPAEPDPVQWQIPPVPLIGNIRGLYPIGLPDVARQTVLEQRRARLRGEGDTLDGHALLARLKVAAALALLEGRRDVTEQDWDLSGVVMAVSDRCRSGVTSYLASRTRAANAARGEAEADRAVTVAERLDDAHIKRVCQVIVRALQRGEGEWMTRRDVARTVAGRDRGVVDEAIGRLLDSGQIAVVDDGGKVLYRLAQKP